MKNTEMLEKYVINIHVYIYILTSQYFCYRISQNQAFLQSGSVLELDMHESKQILPGQFIDSVGLWTHHSPVNI
jgi:hypothetical protein